MTRARGDIDPNNLDVQHKPKQRRKRNKPDPPPAVKAGEDMAIAKLSELPTSPGVMLEPNGEGWMVAAPHNDRNLWEVQLATAVGSRSQAAIRMFLDQLKALCANDWDEGLQRWKCSETEWNAALAMVAEQKPANSSQAALAAQMVAIHWLIMRLSAQALNNGGMVMERDAAIAGKLARTFTMQLEQMQLLKGQRKTTRQSIRVRKETHHHQHIHVHREGPEIEGQPRERNHTKPAKIVDQRETLRSEDTGGRVVPLPRAQGEG
jgi:hypothetical protein